jgi:hypothetical protein
MSESLGALETERVSLLDQLQRLSDFRSGSITGTGGRCGNPGCHCHREGDPGHAPHLRFTCKRDGVSVTESFASPAAQQKAEREIAEFRRYQELSRAFVAVNERICRLRPVEDTLTPQEKKRPRQSARKSRAK